MKKLLAITASVLLLSACSDAPSESDIKSSLEKATTEQLSKLPKELAMKIEIKDIDDVSCEEVSDDVYSCTYTATAETTTPQSKKPIETTKSATAKFKKVDGEWTPVF